MALSRFRQAKTAEEEVNLVQKGVPKSTRYKNKWAFGILEQRQKQRFKKIPVLKSVVDSKITISIWFSRLIHICLFMLVSLL